MAEVDKNLMVFTMREVNTLIACGIGIGVGLSMIIRASIEIHQLEKGTHETQKEYKRGYECGKLMGKIELTNDLLKDINKKPKCKIKYTQTKDNSESTENKTESE